MRCLITVAILTLAATDDLWPVEPKAQTISPDAKIQGMLRRVIYATDDDDKEGREALKEIRQLARNKPDLLAPQLIYYGVHVANEKEGVGMMVMLKHLATTSELRQPLIPLLENKDETVRRETATWLSNIDGYHHSNVESNLMFYCETLLRQKESPSPGLVKHVYNMSPGRALLIFGEVYSEKPRFTGDFSRSLMWSDHVIATVTWRLRHRFLQEGDLDQARKELDVLSKHEGWWARRYAVEVILETRTLGTVDVISRLKKDRNPLVAEPAKLIE
jgi:hypothetical protein